MEKLNVLGLMVLAKMNQFKKENGNNVAHVAAKVKG
jgi:hypothetical protein